MGSYRCRYHGIPFAATIHFIIGLNTSAYKVDVAAMRPPRNMNPALFLSRLALPATKRNTGRVRCEGVRSDLGKVLDLSVGGMRVIGYGLPAAGSLIQARIEGPNECIEVRGKLVWSQRAWGWFRRIAGVEFQGVTPQAAESLTRLAKESVRCEVFGLTAASAVR